VKYLLKVQLKQTVTSLLDCTVVSTVDKAYTLCNYSDLNTQSLRTEFITHLRLDSRIAE